MKIGNIIKEKRIEKGLTQEKVANYLNVSAPAVNKWEKGYSYPDITLIPSLARLLDTDANTLLSFKEDLSKNEVALILNDITSKMENESFVDAYNTAMERIKEYPNSEELIFYSAMVLSGGIELYYASGKDYYKEELDNLFKRVIEGDNDEIREQALKVVCSKYIQNNEFNKAEEIILKLDDKSFDNKMLKNSFYLKKGEFDKSLKLLQEELFIKITEIQNLLLYMINNMLETDNVEDSEYIAKKMEEVADVFSMWEYNKYIGKWQIFIHEQNVDKTIEFMEKLISSMKFKLKNDSILFSKINYKNNMDISKQLLRGLIQEVKTAEELSYLNKSDKFWNFIEKYYNDIKK